MRTPLRIIALVSVATAAAACSGSPSPTPTSAVTPAAPPANPVAVATSVQKPPVVPDIAVPAYEAKGRRDPFEPPVSREGAQGMTLASAKLTGIVRGTSGPLALVETAEGLGYIVKPGDTLAGGRVVEIGQNSVVFSVVPRGGTSTNRVVLRLASD